MAPQGWATPEQNTFLQEHVNDFLAAQKSGTVKRFHENIAEIFFKAFPEPHEHPEHVEASGDAMAVDLAQLMAEKAAMLIVRKKQKDKVQQKWAASQEQWWQRPFEERVRMRKDVSHLFKASCYDHQS